MLVKRLQHSEFYQRLIADKFSDDFFYKVGHMFFCAFLIPFVTYWYFKQEYLLAAIECLVLLFFCANLRQMVIKKEEILPRSIVLIGIGCQLLALSHYAGSSATLWTYPLLATYFFILPIRHANYAAIALVVPMSIILFFNAEQVFIIRFVSSISVMLLVANMIVLINSNLQKELINQSIRDPLTHCYNRRHMASTFKQMANLYQRSGNSVSILLIDIDYFKQIYDQFGHLAGDEVLHQLVDAINQHCRASDMLFRYGGKEFILLLPEANIHNAQIIAEKYRSLLSTIALPDQQNCITVSIGVCEIAPNMSTDDWIKHADQALYQAKADGRNRVCCYRNPNAGRLQKNSDVATFAKSSGH